MYKESYYNVKVVSDDEALLIYNTSSGAFVSVDRENRMKTERLLLEPNALEEADRLHSELIKGSFIVDSNNDEYNEILANFQSGIEDKELMLTILPAETCNFRCPYCYEELRHINMKPETQQAIIKYIENIPFEIESLHIAWYGGEPMLAKEAINTIMHDLKEISDRKNIRFDSRMTTNGYLLTINNFRKLINLGVKFFQVTIDGVKEEHDKLRIFHNGTGTFDTIWANLQKMKYIDDEYFLRIRVNFHKNNYEKVYEFIDLFVDEFGKDKRFFIAFRPIWTSEFPRSQLPICSIMEGMFIQNKLIHYAFGKLGRMEEIHVISPLPKPIKAWCPAQRKNYYIIAADGTLWKCDLAANFTQLSVGELAANGVMKLKNEEISKWINPYIYNNDLKCRQCKYLPICQGGCVYNRYKENPICIFDESLIHEAMKSRYELFKAN